MKPQIEKHAVTFSASAFYRLVAQGVIVDGRAGGLVVGRTLDEGGVPVIRQRGESYLLQWDRAEDGDFLLRPGLRAPQLKLCDGRAAVSVFSHLLITSAEPDDKILWITHDQVLVPAERAAGHLRQLTDMNTTENPFLLCDLDDVLGDTVETE